MFTDKLSISEVFDVEPKNSFPVSERSGNQVVVPSTTEEKLDDIETKALVNIGEMIATTKEAMDDMLEIARATEKGRDFEIFTNMAKTVSDMAVQMAEVAERIEKVKSKTDSKSNQTTVNQTAVFVGTPKDLLSVIRGNKE